MSKQCCASHQNDKISYKAFNATKKYIKVLVYDVSFFHLSHI